MSFLAETAEKMLARADADGLAATHPMRRLAEGLLRDALDFEAKLPNSGDKAFVAWMQASRAYHDYAGEPAL